METITAVGAILSLIDASTTVLTAIGGNATRLFFYLDYYGAAGLFIYAFGSQGMWQLQTDVLCSVEDAHVMEFRASAQADSNIIAVAATIIAQIAITALSLTDLSRTHWIARAAFTFSLLSAIMAVYYATSQYRKLGRCLQPEQVRAWIRGKARRNRRGTQNGMRAIQQEFLPSAASILTISAPSMLLSASLNSFLVGLGIYFGQVWTRGLDEDAGASGSRDVFITYIVGLFVCYSIFGLSSLVVAGEGYENEWNWLSNRIQRYVVAKQGVLRRAETLHHCHTRTERQCWEPTYDVEKDIEANASQTMPSVGDSGTSSPQKEDSPVLDEGKKQELEDVLRELVTLRKQAAEVDERIVHILTQLH